jgi:hypothetical protein
MTQIYYYNVILLYYSIAYHIISPHIKTQYNIDKIGHVQGGVAMKTQYSII